MRDLPFAQAQASRVSGETKASTRLLLSCLCSGVETAFGAGPQRISILPMVCVVSEVLIPVDRIFVGF